MTGLTVRGTLECITAIDAIVLLAGGGARVHLTRTSKAVAVARTKERLSSTTTTEAIKHLADFIMNAMWTIFFIRTVWWNLIMILTLILKRKSYVEGRDECMHIMTIICQAVAKVDIAAIAADVNVDVEDAVPAQDRVWMCMCQKAMDTALQSVSAILAKSACGMRPTWRMRKASSKRRGGKRRGLSGIREGGRSARIRRKNLTFHHRKATLAFTFRLEGLHQVWRRKRPTQKNNSALPRFMSNLRSVSPLLKESTPMDPRGPASKTGLRAIATGDMHPERTIAITKNFSAEAEGYSLSVVHGVPHVRLSTFLWLAVRRRKRNSDD